MNNLESLLSDSIKILKLLSDLGAKNPGKALYQIKRMARTNRLNRVTIKKIIEWGK